MCGDRYLRQIQMFTGQTLMFTGHTRGAHAGVYRPSHWEKTSDMCADQRHGAVTSIWVKVVTSVTSISLEGYDLSDR